MADTPIRVGFIGLNPGIHWAATAHIPALKALQDDYVVVGVANTRLASAQNAADAFGLPHAFENAQALVDSPEVDLVVVTVKVPHHHELVTAALNAGKHVYCEWPLGNGLAEARELADLAEARGVVAAIGTQMRVAPEIAYLRQLIADGHVGEVLSKAAMRRSCSYRSAARAAMRMSLHRWFRPLRPAKAGRTTRLPATSRTCMR